jgi:two-component system OmpR family sensor kinase
VGVEADEAVVEVDDAGPGVPEELEDQIFARFVRGSGPADLATGSGTGLGLAIVKAVATAHGGTVDVGSSPDGGARFTVRMPLATIDEQTLTKDTAPVP